MSGEQPEGMNSGERSLSLADVTVWLRVHNYGATALELFSEVERCTGERYTPLLEAAGSSHRRLLHQREASSPRVGDSSFGDTDLSATSVRTTAMSSPDAMSMGLHDPSTDLPNVSAALSEQSHLSVTLGECLEAFKLVEGEEALTELLSKNEACASVLHCATEPEALFHIAQKTGVQTLKETSDGNESEHAKSLPRVKETEAQLKQLVALIVDSLTTLLVAIDPVKKGALLPLLRSVAIMADSSTSRAAARHAILHLFKRPTEENRQSIVTEWLRVVKAAPARTVEQEVIPELYGLVNARTSERRQLALDCACAVAGEIQNSYKTRLALCQGLLRPLSEDESSAVRRQVPLCLGALWGGGGSISGQSAGCQSPSPQTISGSAPAAADVPTLTAASLAAQSTFPMELAVRLALDPFSNSVRHVARTQLRDVIYPKCFHEHALLTTFVPLLMTFVNMEIGPLRAEESSSSSPSTTPGATAGFVFSSKKEVSSAPPARTIISSTELAYSNIVMLVKLLGDAVQCAKRHLSELRADGKRGGLPAVKASSLDFQIDELCDTYLRVVLPTAHSFLPPLLNTFTLKARTRRQVGGALCGLGALLASLVPALNLRAWERVKDYLLSSIESSLPQDVDDGESRGRLLFFYAVLTRLAGEQGAFYEQQCSSIQGDGRVAERAQSSATALQAFANELGQQSAALILQSVNVKNPAGTLTTDDRMHLLAWCLGQLASIASRENDRLSAGVTAVLWGFTESPAATQRIHLVSLVSRICAQPMEDSIKLSVVCPPLFALLNDADLTVQEMTVKGLLGVAADLTHRTSQEKVLRATLATVEASGCTSDLTFATLHQWEMLLPSMPAEPREVFLYPELNILMDLLSDQQTRRMLTRQQRVSGISTPPNGSSFSPFTSEEQQEQAQWEKVMSGLLSLLNAILRCPVVTPTLVVKYLMPGVQHLSSPHLLVNLTSPQLRPQWERMAANYETFIDHNSAAMGATLQATNLLNRVKDELKRHF